MPVKSFSPNELKKKCRARAGGVPRSADAPALLHSYFRHSRVASPTRRVTGWSACSRPGLLAEHRQGDIEGDVPSPIREEGAGGVGDEDGGALGDPVDAADAAGALVLETDPVAELDGVELGGQLAGGDQVVVGPGVAEDLPGEPVEVLGRAVSGAPGQELGQVQQLVLEDALQGLQPVAADQAAHQRRPRGVAEGGE